MLRIVDLNQNKIDLAWLHYLVHLLYITLMCFVRFDFIDKLISVVD